MTLALFLFNSAAFAASAFMLAAEAGLVPNDVFGVFIRPILWACLTIPGFTDEHEYWIDVGLVIKAACAFFGLPWPQAE